MAAKRKISHEHAKSPDSISKLVDSVVLIPRPPDDSHGPPNWPLRKKIMTLAIISLASCISLAQQLANQAGFFSQAAVYHKKPVEILKEADE